MTTRRAQPRAAPGVVRPVTGDYHAQVRAADALRRSGRYDEAVRAFHALTVQHPQRADAFSNLAGMLQAAGHPTQALQAVTRALELDPASVPALLNSAEILKDFGDWHTVLDTYDAACALQPLSPQARFARALHLLTMGRWATAWAEHEVRWQVPDMPLTNATHQTARWDGTPLQGRHLLLDHEQGLGDQLMCLRFLPEAAARGGRITVRCSPAVAPLVPTVPGMHTVITDADPIPAHDVHASLMSLPWLLGITSPAQLHGGAYLSPVGACPDAIRERCTSPSPRVGLVWAGNAQHRNDARRSIAPALLLPLVQRPGITVISLQRHDARTPALPTAFGTDLRDLCDLLHTLNDTAHALSQLDLLITVDTSVAHLAGALGVRTLLLLPFVPDWRWMTDRSDTPWYDSVTLLRQPTLFDWRPVITAACTAVDTLTGIAP